VLAGRLVVEAENIRDAYLTLAAHFEQLASGLASDLAESGSNCQVQEEIADTSLPPGRPPGLGD